MASQSGSEVKSKRKVNGHKFGPADQEVVRSKVPRGSNGMLGMGGAGLRGTEQAVLHSGGARQGPVYRHKATKIIIRTVFCKLCTACEKHTRSVERELARLEDSHPEDARTTRKLVHYLVEFIRETDQVSSNMETFLQQKWALDASNMHIEFSRVVYQTFLDSTNWGRVIMFIGFAVSFAVYLEQGAVAGAADSVVEWTCQVIEEDLGQYFSSHEGWVSNA